MPTINLAGREITCKIVYYGPGLGGKTTNMEYIHRKTNPKLKGQLVSLATETDRTLFFDFLPLALGKVGGFNTRFQLFTVPGQVFYSASRRIILRGVDGLVFVADSHPAREIANIDSLEDLEKNLRGQNYELKDIPHIFQYNKRDLPSVLPVDEMRRSLNFTKSPDFEAVATEGKGVFETFMSVAKLVLLKVQSDLEGKK